MQMAHSAMILSMVIAFILLSSSLVSYLTMVNDIVFASSDEGGDGGDDGGGEEGAGGEQGGDGGDGEEEDSSSEQPADSEQGLDATDQQPIPEDQLPQSLEEGQEEEVGEFVLCEDTEVFIPETGKCEEDVPQAQSGLNEVCDNQKDDDLDGAVDESDCVPAVGQQTDAPGAIPPSFAPATLAGQTGGWGLPQGGAKGVNQGQGSGSTGSGGDGTSGTTPTVQGFPPSGGQGSGSGPAQGAPTGGNIPVPSFTPSGSSSTGKVNTPSTTPDMPPEPDNQGGDEDSGGTGGGGTSQGGSPGGGGGSGSTTTSAGTSSSTGTGKYTDPEGRFSIGYPPNAKVTPAQADAPGDKVVTFTAPPPTEFTSIGIEVTDTGSPVELENHINSYLVALETALPGYTLVQSPDCVRYALGGQKACAYIYTVGEQTPAATDGSSSPTGQISSDQGSQKAIMEVFSVVGSNLFKISYSTLPSEFNGQLPVTEGMIRSFTLLNSNVS